MITDKQDRKDRWEREHVQRVLDYHNEKYGTRIEIKDKTQDVRPDLKGKSDWDWVCYDTETVNEVAVEVKKITDPKLEERARIMWQLLEEVQENLSDKLPGIFHLSVNIPADYYLPFNKQRNKQEFKDVLSQVIHEASQRLKSGEMKDLMPEIKAQLTFKLPHVFSSFFNLHKFSDEGNKLYKGSGIIGSGSKLKNFEQLVSQANGQLAIAHTNKTFLIFIEEGYRPTDSPEVVEAFTKINTESYSAIRYVYFIRGKKVAEIPLPVTP